MRLPRTPLRRAGALAGALAGIAAVTGLFLASQAGAHPGPMDTSGGHYCTQAQNASGLCAPPTYHRHDPSGEIVVTTPGPEAAQLTGQQATTEAQAPAAAAAPPPGATPVAQPLAQTGPISMSVAVFGVAISMMGLLALLAERRIALPVVLELDRHPAG